MRPCLLASRAHCARTAASFLFACLRLSMLRRSTTSGWHISVHRPGRDSKAPLGSWTTQSTTTTWTWRWHASSRQTTELFCRRRLLKSKKCGCRIFTGAWRPPMTSERRRHVPWLTTFTSASRRGHSSWRKNRRRTTGTLARCLSSFCTCFVVAAPELAFELCSQFCVTPSASSMTSISCERTIFS